MGYRTVFSIALTAAFGLLAGCGTIDRRVAVDADDEVGGAVLRSADIVAMSDQIAREITASPVLRSRDPEHRISFHISSLRNDSSDRIDKELVLTKIRTQLFKAFQGRVRILDTSPEGLEEIRRQRQAKRAGAVTANPNQRGEVAGSDYVLKGTIKDRVTQSGRLRAAYYLVTIELTNLETGELEYLGDYETKFESEKSVISR